MKPRFRSTSSADAAAISSFLQNVFEIAAGNPTVEPWHMRWKYWDPWPDWPESRGYVFDQAGDIVAHGAVVPLTCLWEDRRLKVVRVIDWAASAKSIGSGVALMKRIGQMGDAVMAVGGTEMTLKVFAALGAKKCGLVHRYVFPLRPWRRLLDERKAGWRAAARSARGLLWSLQAPSLALDGWAARRITRDQLDSIAFPLPAPKPGLAVFARSKASLDYYLRSPSVPIELYAVEKHGVPVGYFLIAMAARQVRLVESWAGSDDRGVWRALHSLAVRQARQNQVAVELVTMCSDPVTLQSLVACGFHHRGSAELQLLPSSGKALPEAGLRVQMLEGDAAYLHDGSGSLWA